MAHLPLVVRSAAEVVQRFLDKEFTGRWTASSLASRFGLSPVHLADAFHDLTGRDIPRYVRRLRIARAAELLKAPGVRIAEVAFAVGYNSSPSFVDAFEKELGMLPSVYRARAAAHVHPAA